MDGTRIVAIAFPLCTVDDERGRACSAEFVRCGWRMVLCARGRAWCACVASDGSSQKCTVLLPTVLALGVGIACGATALSGESDSAMGLSRHDDEPARVDALATWTVGDAGVRRADGTKTDLKRIVMLSAIARFPLE